MEDSFFCEENEIVVRGVSKALEDNNLVDLSDTFKNFSVVIESFKLIYASTLDLPCGALFIQVLYMFHTLVNRMFGTVIKFTNISRTSIKLFNDAMKFAEEGDTVLAIKHIEKTEPKANELTLLTQELLDKVDLISIELGKTLIKATGEKSINIIENDKIEAQKVELMAQQAKLRAEIKDFNQQAEDFQYLAKREGMLVIANLCISSVSNIVSISTGSFKKAIGACCETLFKAAAVELKKESDIKEETTNGVDDASQNEKKQLVPSEMSFIYSKKVERDELKSRIARNIELKDQKETEMAELIDIQGFDKTHIEVSNLIKEINDLDKEIKTFNESLIQIDFEVSSFLKSIILKSQDKELAYNNLKSEYKDLSRKSNANLEESIVKMNGLGKKSSNLEKTVRSLEVAIIAMGKIKCNFEKIRSFWDQVHYFCNELKDISLISNKAGKKDFKKSIADSGIQWCAINALNSSTNNDIKKIRDEMDNLISNLPNSDEAKLIVQKKIGENKKLK